MRLFKDKFFYGWILVANFFIMNAIMMGTNSSFGVFFKSLESEFSLSRAATSSIISVRMLLGAVVSLLGGWALDRYGPKTLVLLMGIFMTLSLVLTSQTNAVWQVFFTFSLLLSLGSGASYVVVMSTISRWFDKKRGMAIGFTGAGGGMGQVLMAPLAAFLIASYDWRMAYIVMGIMAGLVIIPISRFLKRDPSEVGSFPDGVQGSQEELPEKEAEDEVGITPTGLTLKQALITRSFWVITVNQVFTSFSVFLIITHIVPHATDLGFSAVESASILSFIGLAMMGGRILVGVASDRVGRKKAAFFSSIVQIGAVLILLWAKELWWLYLFALLHGFTQGGLGTALTALFGDIFGLRNVGKIIGLINISWAVGAAIGPVIGGFIFDASASYHSAFVIIVALLSVRPLLILFIRNETNKGSLW